MQHEGVSVSLQQLQWQFQGINLLSCFQYTVQVFIFFAVHEKVYGKGSKLSYGSTIQHTGATQHNDTVAAAAAAYHSAAVQGGAEISSQQKPLPPVSRCCEVWAHSLC